MAESQEIVREYVKRPRPPLLVSVSKVEWIACRIGNRLVNFVAMEDDTRANTVLVELSKLRAAGKCESADVDVNRCARFFTEARYKDAQELALAIREKRCVPEASVPVVSHYVSGHFTMGSSDRGQKILRRTYPSSWLYAPELKGVSWHQVFLVNPQAKEPFDNMAKQIAAWLRQGLKV